MSGILSFLEYKAERNPITLQDFNLLKQQQQEKHADQCTRMVFSSCTHLHQMLLNQSETYRLLWWQNKRSLALHSIHHQPAYDYLIQLYISFETHIKPTLCNPTDQHAIFLFSLQDWIWTPDYV